MARPTGPLNGSDLLLLIDGKAVGHSTSCTIDITNETKDMAFKPAASEPNPTTGRWKQKRVTGTSVSIKADGLVFYEETEFGYKHCLAKVAQGADVEVKAFMRHTLNMSGGSTKRGFITGNFIITSLNLSASAGEDGTYSISLDNNGEVIISDTSANGLQNIFDTAEFEPEHIEP